MHLFGYGGVSFVWNPFVSEQNSYLTGFCKSQHGPGSIRSTLLIYKYFSKVSRKTSGDALNAEL